MSKKKKMGWYGEPNRHALASRGISTKDMTEMQAGGILGGSDKTARELDAEKLKKRAKEHKKEAKKLKKEGKKEAKEIKKEAGTDWISKTKSGIGSAIDSLKAGYKKGTDIYGKLTGKEDELMGDIVGGDIERSMSSAIAKHKGEETDRKQPDYTKEDVKQLKESGTPAELVRAVRSGKLIDADIVEISDENAQELAQHMADLRHDLEMSEEMVDRMKDKEKEMERYYKEKYEVYHDDLKRDWNAIEGTLGEGHDERLNEVKHKDSMYKIQMQNKVSEHKSSYEFAKDVNSALGEIYKNRKEFTKRWLH